MNASGARTHLFIASEPIEPEIPSFGKSQAGKPLKRPSTTEPPYRCPSPFGSDFHSELLYPHDSHADNDTESFFRVNRVNEIL
jgi:hypothetical protein